jgi:formamidopyrimidine-DNA glycosylase
VVVHLGMTGQVVVCRPGAPRAKHTHVVWSLADGRELRFVDARRFGWVTTVRRGAEKQLPELAELGIEPLGEQLTDARFAALLAASRRAMKAFLLDQSQVAGLGNIYVCEALYLSRIHPRTRSDRVRSPAAAALRAAIVDVLTSAITHRGTSFRDYVDGEGQRGSNQLQLHVYGREGERCRRCGGKIVRTVDGGRSTFFCPRCQKAPRR